MSKVKVSAFPDGAPAQLSDILGAVRGSGNVRLTVGDVLAVAGNSPPRSIGIIGDSKAGDFHAGTTSSENCHWNSQGGLGWYLARNGFPLDCPASFDGGNPVAATGNNRGVSGDTTTQMRARIQADAWDNNYDMLIIRGGTNDIQAGDTAATIIDNLGYMIDGTLSRGTTAVVHTVDQRPDAVGSSYWSNTNGGTTTAQKALIYNQVNEYLRDKAVTTPGMILIDPEAYFTDPATGKLRTDFTPDGTHNSPLAGYWEGQVYEERLSGLVVPTNQAFFNILDLYDATYNPYGNILTNGELAGTAGTASTGDSGSTGVATGVTISRSSGSTITYTASKGTLSYGNATFTMQNIKVTSNGSGAGVETIRARFGSSISAGVVGSAFYEMFGLLKIFAPTGGGGLLLGANCQLKENSPSGAAVSSLRRYLAGSPWPAIEHPIMFMKTPPRKLVSNIVNITCDLLIDVDATVTDDITISFAMCQARRRRTSPATLS